MHRVGGAREGGGHVEGRLGKIAADGLSVKNERSNREGGNLRAAKIRVDAVQGNGSRGIGGRGCGCRVEPRSNKSRRSNLPWGTELRDNWEIVAPVHGAGKKDVVASLSPVGHSVKGIEIDGSKGCGEIALRSEDVARPF